MTIKYIYYEIMLIFLTKCTKLTFNLTVTLTRTFKLGIRPQGGTLKFSVYIGEADFYGVKILNFHIFGGFQKNELFFRVVSFLWIFFWVHAFSELFFGVIYNSK